MHKFVYINSTENCSSIIIAKSRPKRSIEEDRIVFEKIDELSEITGKYFLILDVLDTNDRGNSKYRKEALQLIIDRKDKIKHLLLITQSNSIMKILIKMTFLRSTGINYSIVSSVPEALTLIENM